MVGEKKEGRNDWSCCVLDQRATASKTEVRTQCISVCTGRCFCVPVIPGELRRESDCDGLRYCVLRWWKTARKDKTSVHTLILVCVCGCSLQWTRDLISAVAVQHCCSCLDLENRNLLTIPLHKKRPTSVQAGLLYECSESTREATWIRHDVEQSTSLYGARKRGLWSWVHEIEK